MGNNLCIMNFEADLDLHEFLKSANHFSKMLSRLILFLIKQQPNLDRYTLVKPYDLIIDLTHMHTTNYFGFSLSGFTPAKPIWGKFVNDDSQKYAKSANDYSANNISIDRDKSMVRSANRNGLKNMELSNYVANFDPSNISVRITDIDHVLDESNVGMPSGIGDVDFSLADDKNDFKHVQMTTFESDNKHSDHEIVETFIGMVIAIKQLTDENIKAVKARLDSKKHHRENVKNNINTKKAKIAHSKYSWEKVFKGADNLN